MPEAPSHDPSELPHLRLERPSEGVALLTLDNPDQRNAMSDAMTASWSAAIGAGLCLALACDIRYAAEGAKLGVPFNKLGMHAGMAGTWLLPDVVGPAHARDLLLTGRVVEAQEALRLGLVSRVIDPGSFLDEVLETAAGIAATAPIAARLTKIALSDGGHADFESALQWEALAQPLTLATADLQEGIAAAKEKRAPRFEGR